MFKEIRSWFEIRSISTKITLIFGAFFISLIVLTNVVMWLGISYALYHPAEATIEYSIKNAEKILAESDKYPDELIFRSIHKTLVPGVVLRVCDEKGNLLFDTDEINYPANEQFEQNIVASPTILADKTMKIAQIGNAIVYRADISFYKSGQYLIFYFFRTITSQKNIFEKMGIFMLIIDAMSVIAAVRVSRFISREVLLPVKNMTELANKIVNEKEREGVKERIQLPPANDEIKELAKTFNTMLDHMQNDISNYKKFFSNVSHELHNSLTIVLGYVDVLKKFGISDSELFDESVTNIDGEAQDMRSILENLRFIARGENHNLKFRKENLDLAEIIDTNFRRMKIYVKYHDFQLTQNDSAQIYGDRTAIAQMLRNIINNAVKYTPKGGSIRIDSVVHDDKVLVSIADTGIGIPAEKFDTIFEREVRLTNDPFVAHARGCGIGLSMAKMVAEGHDIDIGIESTVGEGTTFTLSIPLAK